MQHFSLPPPHILVMRFILFRFTAMSILCACFKLQAIRLRFTDFPILFMIKTKNPLEIYHRAFLCNQFFMNVALACLPLGTLFLYFPRAWKNAEKRKGIVIIIIIKTIYGGVLEDCLISIQNIQC